jgi:hypothetical protein
MKSLKSLGVILLSTALSIATNAAEAPAPLISTARIEPVLKAAAFRHQTGPNMIYDFLTLDGSQISPNWSILIGFDQQFSTPQIRVTWQIWLSDGSSNYYTFILNYSGTGANNGYYYDFDGNSGFNGPMTVESYVFISAVPYFRCC